MRIDAQTYREASAEHVSLARELYAAGRYVYAIYVAGVSVECLLRSQMPREGFDSRHELPELLQDSRFLDSLPPRHVVAVTAALGSLWARWRNTHRYFSAARLKKHVIDQKMHRGVKGDPVKEAARVAVDSALTIINRGMAPWVTR